MNNAFAWQCSSTRDRYVACGHESVFEHPFIALMLNCSAALLFRPRRRHAQDLHWLRL